MSPITVVLGASAKSWRYAHKACLRLLSAGEQVVAIGGRKGMIGDLPIHTELPADVRVDTVTIYLSAANQHVWKYAVIQWRPRRVIFNPGAENAAFADHLVKAGIEVIHACTLVMIATGGYRNADQPLSSDRLG